MIRISKSHAYKTLGCIVPYYITDPIKAKVRRVVKASKRGKQTLNSLINIHSLYSIHTNIASVKDA